MINLAIGTKKGAFILQGDRKSDWKLSEPILFGNMVYHMVPDPRNKNIILLATKTGHLGPTVFRSDDDGKTIIVYKKSSSPQFRSFPIF